MDKPATEPEGSSLVDFSTLYEANYKRIFNYILIGTGNIETALDLTSETFFKALRAWPRFEDKGVAPTAWLLKIASRELAMFYRRQGLMKRFAPLLEFNEEAVSVRREVVETEVLAARHELESREDFMVLSPLIRKLPAKYREVIFLRFFAAMSLDEIAESLDRPTGTIKAQLHRALKRLRADMQPSQRAEHLLLSEAEMAGGVSDLEEEVD